MAASLRFSTYEGWTGGWKLMKVDIKQAGNAPTGARPKSCGPGGLADARQAMQSIAISVELQLIAKSPVDIPQAARRWSGDTSLERDVCAADSQATLRLPPTPTRDR